jgi:ribosomal protein S18 acetylase RimI-like enzyme
MAHSAAEGASGTEKPGTPRLTEFAREHLDGALALFAAEGWGTYTADPERTYRALLSPASTTLVALDGATVIGVVQLQSDGEIQAHLSALVVANGWRGAGLGRGMLREALDRAGGIRIDILSRSERFYRRLGARPVPGFRLTREDLRLLMGSQSETGR